MKSPRRFLELLSLHSKSTIDNVKVIGSIQKEYDKQNRSYYYNLDTPNGKLQVFKNDKFNFKLSYTLLIFQLYVPPNYDFAFEVIFSDGNNVL